jgi:hypothetical protein
MNTRSLGSVAAMPRKRKCSRAISISCSCAGGVVARLLALGAQLRDVQREAERSDLGVARLRLAPRPSLRFVVLAPAPRQAGRPLRPGLEQHRDLLGRRLG